MQQTIGLGDGINKGDNNVMWKNRSDNRDEDVFAHLP